MKVPFIPYPGRVECTVNTKPAVVFENQVAYLPKSYALIRTETEIVGAIDLDTKKSVELDFNPLGFGDRITFLSNLRIVAGTDERSGHFFQP